MVVVDTDTRSETVDSSLVHSIICPIPGLAKDDTSGISAKSIVPIPAFPADISDSNNENTVDTKTC